MSGVKAGKILALLACVVLAGCGGLPEPVAPPAPPASSSPTLPAVEELPPKVAAALVKAGQPLGAPTTATRAAEPGATVVRSWMLCETIIGSNFGGSASSLFQFSGPLAQTMTVGEAGERSPGVRVEAEVAYRARTESAGRDYSCPGAHLTNVPMRSGAGVVGFAVRGSQSVAPVAVAGRSGLVVRTTVAEQDARGSFVFLPGQVRVVLVSQPWYVNVAVLRARPAAPSEVARLTDEAQQIAIEFIDRFFAEAPR